MSSFAFTLALADLTLDSDSALAEFRSGFAD